MGNEREGSSESFIFSLAVAGGVMATMGHYMNDVSMKVMGGIFLFPPIVDYSARVSYGVYRSCRELIFSRDCLTKNL